MKTKKLQTTPKLNVGNTCELYGTTISSLIHRRQAESKVLQYVLNCTVH